MRPWPETLQAHHHAGDQGYVTKLGKLTVQGQVNVSFCCATVGPQPGQLCIGLISPPHVYIVNITTDSIIHRPVVPPEKQKMDHIATLPTGEILVADEGGKLAWYRSVSEPAVLLRIPQLLDSGQ